MYKKGGGERSDRDTASKAGRERKEENLSFKSEAGEQSPSLLCSSSATYVQSHFIFTPVHPPPPISHYSLPPLPAEHPPPFPGGWTAV